MRCNPWRWLWGVIPIAMLTWLAFTWEREGIETDLRSRSEAALESAGFGWGEVSLDGRDALLTGVAPDDAQPYRAIETVRNIRGIRIVRGRTDAAPAQVTADAQPAPKHVEDSPPPSAPAVVEEPKAPEPRAPEVADKRLSAEERAALEAKWAEAQENERRWKAAGQTTRFKSNDDAAAATQAKAHDDAEKQRLADEEARKAQAETAAAEEAKRHQDEEKAAEAEKQRLAEEESRKAEAKHKAEADAAAEADRKAKAEADAADAAAKQRESEEAARAAEADKQKLSEDEQRKADEKEQAESEAEAQRLADEKAKAEEEATAKQKADDDAAAAKRAEEQAEAKRKNTEQVAAARQQAQENAKQKAEADHCQGLMRSAMGEGVINFSRAKSDLTKDSFLTLDRLAGIVKVCPKAHINIAGHTDGEGEPARNQGLSERRAKAVADYLIGKGVEASRMTSEGFGATRPIAANDNPEGMRQNRRIEFSVTPAP